MILPSLMTRIWLGDPMVFYLRTRAVKNPYSNAYLATCLKTTIFHTKVSLNHIWSKCHPCMCVRVCMYMSIYTYMYYYFCMEEVWQHVSLHWQQGKYQLWENCFMRWMRKQHSSSSMLAMHHNLCNSTMNHTLSIYVNQDILIAQV